MWGGEGHDLLSKKPLSSLHPTTWEVANLMISLSTAPNVTFLNVISQSPFKESKAHALVPWAAVLCCLAAVRAAAAADICRYLDSISPPTSTHPPSSPFCQLVPASPADPWSGTGWALVPDRPTTYYSVTQQLLQEGASHHLTYNFSFFFSPVSHLPRLPPPPLFSSWLHRLHPLSNSCLSIWPACLA